MSNRPNNVFRLAAALGIVPDPCGRPLSKGAPAAKLPALAGSQMQHPAMGRLLRDRGLQSWRNAGDDLFRAYALLAGNNALNYDRQRRNHLTR